MSQDEVMRGSVRCGLVRQSEERRGQARCGRAMFGPVSRGTARIGLVRIVCKFWWGVLSARLGSAWHGSLRFGMDYFIDFR